MITTILTIVTIVSTVGFYVEYKSKGKLKADVHRLQNKLKFVEEDYLLKTQEVVNAELQISEISSKLTKLQEKVDLEVSKRLSEISEEFKEALDKIGKPFMPAEAYPTTLKNKIHVVQGVYIKHNGEIKINSEHTGYLDLKSACFDFESYKKILVDGVKRMIDRNERFIKIDDNGEFVKIK